MSSKENLSKAVFDMFGVGSDTGVNEDGGANAGVTSSPENLFVPSYVSPASTAPVRASAASVVTYLAPGTSMEGHLKAKGDVDIAGNFKGDITAAGHVNLRSNIDGNITADRLDVNACILTGDVHVSGVVNIDSVSSIAGNVFAGELLCAGKIEGNLGVSGNTSLQKGAQIYGDISTGTLTMERGAFINGGLTMNTKPDQEKKSAEAPAKPAAAAPEEKPAAVIH
ncbi:MAG: polymer-forming cytoskeletal protein [Oscillibacter sp.]